MEKQVDVLDRIKKDYETVMNWRKFGKSLDKEQESFANRLADEMIALRVNKQVGVQLVSKANIDFIKKGIVEKSEPAGIVQDAVAIGPAKKDCACGKANCDCVAKASITQPKAASLGESAPKGALPRNTGTIETIKQDCPENCRCGEVSAVADEKTDPKETSTDSNGTIGNEEIGHNPELPMPKKMAEELIQNANWGVEIGAYSNLKEGIERQLGRKDYAEFIDTDEKLQSVMEYLDSVETNIKTIPVD